MNNKFKIIALIISSIVFVVCLFEIFYPSTVVVNRIIEKKWAHELLLNLEKGADAKVLYIENLDNDVEGNVLIIFERKI